MTKQESIRYVTAIGRDSMVYRIPYMWLCFNGFSWDGKNYIFATDLSMN